MIKNIKYVVNLHLINFRLPECLTFTMFCIALVAFYKQARLYSFHYNIDAIVAISSFLGKPVNYYLCFLYLNSSIAYNTRGFMFVAYLKWRQVLCCQDEV